MAKETAERMAKEDERGEISEEAIRSIYDEVKAVLVRRKREE